MASLSEGEPGTLASKYGWSTVGRWGTVGQRWQVRLCRTLSLNIGNGAFSPPLVDEKSLESCELRGEGQIWWTRVESWRPVNRLLLESWQEEMMTWIRVVTVEIVKNVDILRYFESCTCRICCWTRWRVRGRSSGIAVYWDGGRPGGAGLGGAEWGVKLWRYCTWTFKWRSWMYASGAQGRDLEER